MSRTLIATAVLVLLGLAAPIGLDGVVLPVHAQEDGGGDGGGSQSDDAGDQTGTDDSAPATAADPGEAPADGTQVACVEGEPCPEVVCVEGKPCFKDLTLGGPIQQHINSDLKTK
jgi:hypothetical protein